MKRFAIRHKATGKYLYPGRGSAHWDPVHDPDPTTPRLFASKQGALACIRWWKEGAVTVHRNYDWNDCYEDWNINRNHNRKASDLEVIPVTLTFGELT